MIMIKLLLALLIKHAICDMYLQNKRSFTDKSKYIGECHTHYLDHFLATLLVCHLFAIPIEFSFFLASIDYIAHWHIDYTKTKIIRFFKISLHSIVFWLLQTIDQILHYSTYFLIVYIVQSKLSLHDIFEKYISPLF